MTTGKRSIKTAGRREHWQEVIGEQRRSGLSIRAFCGERQVPEHSFYMWRKTLRRESEPVRFALVETAIPAAPSPLELLLGSGHILRIGPGVDAATLRTVVGALSAQA